MRVSAQQLGFDLGQGRFRSLNLMQNVDAVAIGFEHALQTLDLTFDAFQSTMYAFAQGCNLDHDADLLVIDRIDSYPIGV
jgi:hypothetical protein